MLLALLLSAPPVIPYVAEPPVVDGLRDDSAWTEALVLDDLRVIEPNVGADPTDPIEVRLVKDQEALWVLFVAGTVHLRPSVPCNEGVIQTFLETTVFTLRLILLAVAAKAGSFPLGPVAAWVIRC